MVTRTRKAKVTKKREVIPDKTPQTGITVVLGGKEYLVRPLVIRESREWRRKAGPFQAAIARYASVNSDDPEALEQAIIELLTKRIDEAVELFFEYAHELDREMIESVATDMEIIKAINKVNTIAFPFGEMPA